MTPPTIPPIGTLLRFGNMTNTRRRVTPAWIDKRLRRHAGAPARIKQREFETKQRQIVHNVA